MRLRSTFARPREALCYSREHVEATRPHPGARMGLGRPPPETLSDRPQEQLRSRETIGPAALPGASHTHRESGQERLASHKHQPRLAPPQTLAHSYVLNCGSAQDERKAEVGTAAVPAPPGRALGLFNTFPKGVQVFCTVRISTAVSLKSNPWSASHTELLLPWSKLLLPPLK